ncbi:MAG TPA: TusE/DsrC/DsvC family sulfur relay protein, partial [Solirubrobacteraceae bacterium]|nr:TusE/DsrC/DsvC family sulfur relay protein [Solirubrobacteraceae bacterium]
ARKPSESTSTVSPASDRQWQVINFMRKTYLETGSAPSIRSLGKTSGVPIKELYELFPRGPAKLAANPPRPSSFSHSRRHLAAPCSSQRSNSETCPLGHAPSHGMLPSLSRPAIAWP